jgi:hypothetical protein
MFVAMRWGAWLWVVPLLCASYLLGQQTPLLVPVEKVIVPGYSSAASVGPPSCDAEGNLYEQGTGPQDVGPWPELVKISPEGRVVARFSVGSIPDKEVREAGSNFHTVDTWGRLYLLVPVTNDNPTRKKDEDKVFIVRFEKEGKFEGVARLKVSGFLPYQLAVFPTGEYVLTGLRRNDLMSRFSEVYTAIFDSRGALVKELALPEDISLDSVKASADPETLTRPDGKYRALEQAALYGNILIGPDGNAYLVRASRSPLLYVLSAYGTVVRRMVLEPPGEGLWPVNAYLAGGRLLIPFAKRSGMGLGTELYSLYDAQSGDHLVDYRPSPGLAGAFECYTPDRFTFTGIEPDGRMSLIQAKPH